MSYMFFIHISSHIKGKSAFLQTTLNMATNRKEGLITKDQTDKLIDRFKHEENLWNVSSEKLL